ncbi:MAG: hypothetical protein QOK37_898 [Thermoanaerobaculia bacterium]|jgi:hypothetical protein|nr:hypothetical protein [Thermoanaerobaculia bacterium]
MSSPEDYARPTRRPLKIFAFDPMLGRVAGNRATVQIANEADLKPGPFGERVGVIDYDGANRCYYQPVNLDDEAILMQGGLDPTESDPRFHQQMVYAVAMRVIENFDRALGRRVSFRGKQLRLFPHAFKGANAFFDPDPMAIFFGYFTADKENPGANIPGQTVFSCLSHDIISHEMTHAMVHRLRHRFDEASNRDVFAFHEGFSDIVAIFQHFSFPEVLTETIQKTRTQLSQPGPLVELAQQFGYATGAGEALRSVRDPNHEGKPDKNLYRKLHEPHDRGSILVAAIFDSFFATYQQRIRDLIRIATGGSGLLPEGYLHPDLVNRIAGEASKSAQYVLNMCIRAFEYLPPVDITYGDYLRAMVTADREVAPGDEYGQRAALIEAFRVRGIYPKGVTSLAEEALMWEPRIGSELPLLPKLRDKQLSVTARAFDRRSATPDEEKELGEWAQELRAYAMKNRRLLDLDPRLPVALDGFHSVFRFSTEGQLIVELVAQFVQTVKGSHARFGGVPLRGGSTIIASADGQIRYVIAKPLPGKHLADRKDVRELADQRVVDQEEFVAECDLRDPFLPWSNDHYLESRMRNRFRFSALHGMAGLR